LAGLIIGGKFESKFLNVQLVILEDLARNLQQINHSENAKLLERKYRKKGNVHSSGSKFMITMEAQIVLQQFPLRQWLQDLPDLSHRLCR